MASGDNPSTTDDEYNGYTIRVTNGEDGGSNDMTTITDYNGSTYTATISVISGAPSTDGSSSD